MSTSTSPITVIGPTGDSLTLDAVVDTGAAFATIPADVLDRLCVRSRRTARLRLVSGEVVEWRLGWARAALDGLEEPILCVFGSQDAPPLIGAHTLEAFLLAVDPVGERLVRREGWLL